MRLLCLDSDEEEEQTKASVKCIILDIIYSEGQSVHNVVAKCVTIAKSYKRARARFGCIFVDRKKSGGLLKHPIYI